jgi:hypothetical protein
VIGRFKGHESREHRFYIKGASSNLLSVYFAPTPRNDSTNVRLRDLPTYSSSDLLDPCSLAEVVESEAPER